MQLNYNYIHDMIAMIILIIAIIYIVIVAFTHKTNK